MRVTNGMVLQSTLHNLNSSLSRLQNSQQDMSTGKSLRKMSDDPTRGVSAMTVRTELRRSEQRQRTADSTQSALEVADTTLVSSLDILGRAKELTVRASNGGASDATSRAAVSSELAAIRDELIAVANTKFLDRPIFNGTAAGAAYDAATGAYLGNDATIVRDVGAGISVTANLTGEQIFGAQSAPSGDLFAVLDRLSTAIASGDMAAIELEHANLDTATTRVSSAAAEVGARSSRLEGIRERANRDELELRDTLSGLEDVDLAEAIIANQVNETAYTAALQAAARIIPPSLLDYLR